MNWHTEKNSTTHRPTLAAARMPRRLSLALSCLALGLTAFAGDDLLVLPAQQEVSTIPFDGLLANDEGSSIQAITPAARGVLDIQYDSLSYQPGPEFATAGLDSFNYQTAAPWNELQTVHLVRGLDQILSAGNAVDLVDGVCSLTPGWSLPDGQEGLSLVPDGAGDCVIQFDLARTLGDPRVQGPQPMPGPAGGHTELVLDGGGELPSTSGQLQNLLLTAANPSDEDEIILGVRQLEDGAIVAFALQDDGSYAETAPVDFAHTTGRLGLTWWYETTPDLRDGGLLLQVDGEAMTSRLEIHNHGFKSTGLSWSFGPVDFTSSSGLVIISDISIWDSFKPMRLPPHFSDHAFLPSGWSEANPSHTSNLSAPGSQDPEWHLGVPAAGDSTWLVATSPDPLGRYRARFELGLEALSMPNWSILRFFQSQTPGPVAPMSPAVHPWYLEMFYKPGVGHHIRGRAAHGGPFLASTPWMPIAASSGRPLIEVAWRAATDATSADGVFVLRVNNTQHQLTGLDNAGLEIGQVHLGPTQVSSGFSGSLIVDAFDSWR